MNSVKVTYVKNAIEGEINGLINVVPIIVSIFFLIISHNFLPNPFFFIAFIILFFSILVFILTQVYNNSLITITSKGIILKYKNIGEFYHWEEIDSLEFIQGEYKDNFAPAITLYIHLRHRKIKIIIGKYLLTMPKEKYNKIVSLIKNESIKEYDFSIKNIK